MEIVNDVHDATDIETDPKFSGTSAVLYPMVRLSYRYLYAKE
jgi:hypothetical protein